MSSRKTYILAFDLGTGGLKASLYQENGESAADLFLPYETFYPAEGFREQRPADWWAAVCQASQQLLADRQNIEVAAVSLSGHSLAPVLLDCQGNLVLDQIPIWSDTRATAEAKEFFTRVNYEDWYLMTGNGDPPETYTVMKLMWFQKHLPDAWAKAAKVVGSKDYINFLLTGETGTDFSYASGCGVFDLKHLAYYGDYIKAAGLPFDIFPPVAESHEIIGRVHKKAAAATGLPEGTPVACGGVDNACMALGAVGIGEGRVYTSLGSSAWIAATSRTPSLDPVSRPFIFAHAQKGYYTSGVSIFSAGNAYRWAAEQLCADLPEGPQRYAAMDKLAAKVPPGANGLLFCPALAGGSSQEPGVELRGAFAGLSMGSSRGDILRAVLEGVALSLNGYCLETLKRYTSMSGEMVLCGGGAKSPLWNQIFADVFGMDILLRGNEQGAASLGAAAIGAKAVGLWKDYSPLDRIFRETERYSPRSEAREFYQRLEQIFLSWIEASLPSCKQLQKLARISF